MAKRIKKKTPETTQDLPKQLFVTIEGSGEMWWLGKASMDDVEIERGEEKIIGVYKLDSVVISQVQVVTRPKVT